MKSALAKLVRERARNCCEYCRLPEALSSIPFEFDHIIAIKHSGETESNNLALSCFYCNSSKGPNIAELIRFQASSFASTIHAKTAGAITSDGTDRPWLA